jgi:hypothetical protein
MLAHRPPPEPDAAPGAPPDLTSRPTVSTYSLGSPRLP